MDVSIIIVNYNTCAVTLECIDSIFKWTSGLDFEVIVVDNGSKDNSSTVLGNDGRIKFIESGGNLGFGRANNLALEYAEGEYVLLLNSDTVLVENAVCAMWNFLKKTDLNIGALGTVLQNEDGDDIHSSAFFPSPWKSVWNVMKQHFARLAGKKMQYGMREAPYDSIPANGVLEVDYVTGADLMAKRETFEKYGAFDPDFFLYYEETEMQFRWRRAGLVNCVIPVRGITHLEGASTGSSTSVSRRKIQMKGERLYFKKTMNPLLRPLFGLCHRIAYLPLSLRKTERKADRKTRLETECVLALDCRPFASEMTGIANVLRSLIDNLAENHPQIRLVLLSPCVFHESLNRDYTKYANITLVQRAFISRRLPKLLWYNLYMPFLLKRYGVNEFITVRTELPLWLPGRIRKTAFVHDVVALEYPETMEFKNRIVNRLFFSRTIRKADLLWCISLYTKNKVIHYFPESSEKIAITGLGSDTNLFRKLNLTPQEKKDYLLGLGVIGRPLLFVGSLEPRKNLSFLLKLMPELSRKGFQLIVVGAKGWKNSDIANIVNSAEFPGGSVLFTGYVSDNELVKLYNCAECYVSTSLNEGFGLPQLEAMLCGCRVVSPDNSAMSEVVGGRGELISSWDAGEWIERIVSYCGSPVRTVDLTPFLWPNLTDSFVKILMQ